MPIYEYQCTKCGEVFEAFQKITDEPLTRCKFCHCKVEKLISQSSFQLKGSGWYLTDYAKKSSSSALDKPKSSDTTDKTETTKSSSDATKSSSETKTDTKSAEKSSESKA